MSTPLDRLVRFAQDPRREQFGEGLKNYDVTKTVSNIKTPSNSSFWQLAFHQKNLTGPFSDIDLSFENGRLKEISAWRLKNMDPPAVLKKEKINFASLLGKKEICVPSVPERKENNLWRRAIRHVSKSDSYFGNDPLKGRSERLSIQPSAPLSKKEDSVAVLDEKAIHVPSAREDNVFEKANEHFSEIDRQLKKAYPFGYRWKIDGYVQTFVSETPLKCWNKTLRTPPLVIQEISCITPLHPQWSQMSEK